MKDSLARLFSRGLTNLSNSISSMAEMTSGPMIVFLLWLVATVLAWEVAYNTNTLAACNKQVFNTNFAGK